MRGLESLTSIESRKDERNKMNSNALREKTSEGKCTLFRGEIVDVNSQILRTVIGRMPVKDPLVPPVKAETVGEECPDTWDCETEESIECEPDTQNDCPTNVSCPSIDTSQCPSQSCPP